MKTYDEIRGDLEPILQELYKIIHGAWKRWVERRDKDGVIYDNTTRANMVSVYVKDAVRHAFPDSRAGFRIIETHQLFLLAVGTEIILRFKKVDESGYTRNFPTKQSLDFDRQVPIEGIPSALRINVGYVLDDMQLQIATVKLSCTNKGGGIAWTRDIDPTSWTGVEIAPMLPFPAQPASPAAESAPPRRVRVTGVPSTKAAKAVKRDNGQNEGSDG